MQRGIVETNAMTISTLPRQRAQVSTSLGAFYAASFLVVGIQLPFWPVWLAGRGLDAQDIALLFAAAIWAKVVATPIIGALADRLGRGRAVMVALAAIACLGYAALWPARSFWALLWLNLVAGVAQSTLMPLGDSITLAAVRSARLDYGRIRVWGSISFIIAAVGSGWLLGGPSTAALDNTVLALVLAASVTLLLTCLAIPSAPAGPVIGSRWRALGHFAADRRFWLFVASGAALNRAISSITASARCTGASLVSPTR
jgi:PPP family 3-phenylpropionic acid transporter